MKSIQMLALMCCVMMLFACGRGQQMMKGGMNPVADDSMGDSMDMTMTEEMPTMEELLAALPIVPHPEKTWSNPPPLQVFPSVELALASEQGQEMLTKYKAWMKENCISGNPFEDKHITNINFYVFAFDSVSTAHAFLDAALETSFNIEGLPFKAYYDDDILEWEGIAYLQIGPDNLGGMSRVKFPACEDE